MPTVITILQDSYFNALRNGGDFSLNPSEVSANLNGNVMERARKLTQFEIEWYALASALDPFTFDNVNNFVVRQVGSFLDDGFKVGHTFDWVDRRGASPTVEFTGTITEISTSGKSMVFTVDSGTVPNGEVDSGVAWARADLTQNYLTALVYRFGLVDNQAPISYLSEVSGTEQVYNAKDIGTGAPRDTNFVDANTHGTVKDWVTGNLQVRFVSNDTYHQVFEVRHKFTPSPWYLDGELTNLQTVVNPDRLLGTATLKYIYGVDFRQTLTNPNTGIFAEYDSSLGNVGWFNENGNGLTSDYSILSIQYLDIDSGDILTSLRSDKITRVIVTIDRLSAPFVAGEAVMGFASFLPIAQDYQGTTTTMLDNFVYDSIRVVEGAGDVLQTNVIKRASASLAGSAMVLEMDLEYSTAQGVYVDEGNYLLSVQCEDASLSAQDSDRVMLLADVRAFQKQDAISLAAQFTGFKFVQHPDEALTGVFESTIASWNQDGIVVEFFFDVDLVKSTVVNSLSVQIVAFNEVDNTDFLLDEYNYDLSSTVTSGGVQQLVIDNERGYFLATDSQFNWVKLRVGNRVGDLQSYFGAIGQKVPWEDWIRNLNADTSFLSPTEPNQGLNYKSSNYSRDNNYIIKAKGVMNITTVNDLGQTVSGDVIGFSDEILVNDYAKDKLNNPVKWTQSRVFLDPDTLQDLGNAVLADKPTLFRVTHVFADAPIVSLDGIYAIHFLQIENDNGKQIHELSTIRPYPSGNYLIPLTGESFLKMYIDSGNVVTECLIDNNALTEGVIRYIPSARIQR